MFQTKNRFMALFVLALSVSFSVQTAAQSRAAVEWKSAFELAFDTSSPYCSKFPSLYAQPYKVNEAITKEVLDRVVVIALKETGARRVKLAYLPGGYMNFDVQPSAQLDARATREQTRTALNVIGYLAQQSLVIASRRTPRGEKAALQITQTRGSGLDSPAFAQKFWRRLSALELRLNPGFSGTLAAGRPGLYLIDIEGDWPPAKADDSLRAAVAAASDEFKIVTSWIRFRVAYLDAGNDWKQYPNGEQYLRNLKKSGRGALAMRLEKVYRPRVERWIAEAFRRQGDRVVKTPCQEAAAAQQIRAKAKSATHLHAPSRIRVSAPAGVGMRAR